MKSKQHHVNRLSQPVKFLTLCLGPVVAGLSLQSLQAASATWDGGASTNVLNTAANWTSDTLPTTALDIATWDGTAAGDLSLIWNASFGPSSGNAGGVNINLAGTQTGSVQLDSSVTSQFGLGDITIASGAGAFTLGDGTGTANVTFRDPSTLFTNDSANTATFKSDLVFANGGGGGGRNLAFAGSGNWLVEGPLVSASFSAFASANLTKTGTGSLTLSGANSHGGGTTISGGTLAVTNSAALGTGNMSIAGRLQLSNGIAVSGVANYNLTGQNQSTTAANARIENVSGTNSISGNINIANPGGLFVNLISTSGSLTLSGGLTATAAAADRTFHFAGAGDITVSGAITTGTATTMNVAKSGAGILTLSGANTYAGTTTINGGTLALGSTDAVGSSGPIQFGGGTLQYSATNTTDYSARIASGTSTGAISIDTNSQNIAFASGLSASQTGGLTKTGSGTLTLQVANAHSGATTISGGLLDVQNSTALSPGIVTVSGGRLLLSNDIALSNEIHVAGQSNSPVASSGRIENVSGSNSISGNIIFNATGGLYTGITSSSGTLTLGGNLTTTLATGPRGFSFSGAGNTIVTGAIADGASAVVGITKSGAGTVTFSGASTYTGDTTVSAGILVVSNNSATTFADTSTVSIASTAVLNLPNVATDTVASLVINGSPLAAGLYDSSSPATTGYITGSGKIQVSGLTGYSSWSTTHAGGQTAEKDFDLDGVKNGVEYFMNSATGFTANPVVVTAGSVRTVTWSNGGNIPASAYGTQFVVQISTDLVNWTDVPSGSLTTNTNGPGGSLTYTLSGTGKSFARLKVVPN